MINMLKGLFSILYIKVKIAVYTFLDYVTETKPSIEPTIEFRHRHQENSKLAKGVRKLVARLRSMTPEERLNTENLLGKESYKKSRKEKMDALKTLDKVIKNPILKTEDDLVGKVVSKAPIYVKEQELGELRKAITACLRAATVEPDNKTHVETMKSLKAKFKLLKMEIDRMKLG